MGLFLSGNVTILSREISYKIGENSSIRSLIKFVSITQSFNVIAYLYIIYFKINLSFECILSRRYQYRTKFKVPKMLPIRYGEIP